MELVCRVAAYLNNSMQRTALRAAADAERYMPSKNLLIVV